MESFWWRLSLSHLSSAAGGQLYGASTRGGCATKYIFSSLCAAVIQFRPRFNLYVNRRRTRWRHTDNYYSPPFEAALAQLPLATHRDLTALSRVCARVR
jgi:hypothetical protein